MDRYHRQKLLPQIGAAGQNRLSEARVLLIGVGALGCTVADQLVRAGVGQITLVDRDVVDETNLHGQILFNDLSAITAEAKVSAAAKQLRLINADTTIDALASDVTSQNISHIVDTHRPTLLIDSTDNAESRYLMNDTAIRSGLPLVYGGCVGTEGRVMGIIPGYTPCLRCLFPQPPAPGELPTCDTAGVLGAAAMVVGALQATEAIRLIVSLEQAIASPAMVTLDVWTRRYKTIDLTDARDPACRTCAMKQFDFLNAPARNAVTLCGRQTVQVRLPRIPADRYANAEVLNADNALLDLIEPRLRAADINVVRNSYLLRFAAEAGIDLTVFADGRVLIHGTDDPARARAIVARYLG